MGVPEPRAVSRAGQHRRRGLRRRQRRQRRLARHRADPGAGHAAVAAADAAAARRPDPETRVTQTTLRRPRGPLSSPWRSSRCWRSARRRHRRPGVVSRRRRGARQAASPTTTSPSGSTRTRSCSSGTLRLTWRNPSTDSVPDLWFHLYLNAFRDRASTFWRESRGQLRDVAMPENGWGWIDVTTLRIADGADLLASLTFEAPDDGNRRDRTLARVRLPPPVAPGADASWFTAPS